MAKSLQDDLAHWRDSFRSLVAWNITIGGDHGCTNGAGVNAETRTAVIYEWGGDGPKPHDYVLHELLHIVFAEATRSPKVKNSICPRADCKCEEEEMLVQDLCGLLTMGR